MINDCFVGHNANNITDLRAEKLYREAEDDFRHFSKPCEALEKLDRAIKYSPGFAKGLRFKGDILLLSGKFKEALDLYKTAENLSGENPQICTCIANSYLMLEEYTKAMVYVEKGLNCEKKPFGGTYKALFDLKTTILINQQKYEEAEKTLENARYNLYTSELDELRGKKLSLIKQKKEMLNKIKRSYLKIIK